MEADRVRSHSPRDSRWVLTALWARMQHERFMDRAHELVDASPHGWKGGLILEALGTVRNAVQANVVGLRFQPAAAEAFGMAPCGTGDVVH